MRVIRQDHRFARKGRETVEPTAPSSLAPGVCAVLDLPFVPDVVRQGQPKPRRGGTKVPQSHETPEKVDPA
jgi:hypothetical protein